MKHDTEQSGSNASALSSDIEEGRLYSTTDFDGTPGLTGFFMQLIGYNHWLWLFNKIQCRRQLQEKK